MASPSPDRLRSALKKYWGHDEFRPRQEEIVQSLLAGRDVAVVMPTGGGKSLCYQLPAVVIEKTAVVISPLIALMQDQVVQLEGMGIPAAYLNSTQNPSAQTQVMWKAVEGAYRVVYLSPERIAREDTLAWLSRVPVSFFAIDEAHCISEWGHEFRPEYRQLQILRQKFPHVPIAAFTASATRLVRQDMIRLLQLRDPDKYIRSFQRPNLYYLVRKVNAATQDRLLVEAVRAHVGKNVIVYAPTIARVQETIEFLRVNHIAAVPYHGQMKGPERQANQDCWMAEEIPVLVGTIAFGLGINKPNVRAVIHLSLPKSIEQYYQEAGRAGRDGKPADCALLWQPRDVPLLIHFIRQLNDRDEIRRSWRRLDDIRKFADHPVCRALQICRHFGETPKWTQCGRCDVCSDGPAWFQISDQKRKRRSRQRR